MRERSRYLGKQPRSGVRAQHHAASNPRVHGEQTYRQTLGVEPDGDQVVARPRRWEDFRRAFEKRALWEWRTGPPKAHDA